jgi:hypothetical protein
MWYAKKINENNYQVIQEGSSFIPQPSKLPLSDILKP